MLAWESDGWCNMRLRQQAGFIFDMDGCLLDSIHIWHEAEQRVLDSAGIELTKGQRDELNALTLEEAGAWFHETFGIMGGGGEVAHAITDHMLEFYRTEAQASPGAFAFARAVHDAGAPMCVLSSSPQSFIRAGLAHSGLAALFPDERLIISAEDRGLTKRSPETFDYVCGLLDCEATDTWLFDDSWYALATAHEAGLRCVGVFSADGCGMHEELARYSERVVDDFTELDPGDFLL